MQRILILCLLAMGLTVFAVDSSQVILQAKKIRETSVVLSWTNLPEASKYKVFYDEAVLIDPKNPSPLLSTDFIEAPEVEIASLTSNLEYYFIVHAYDRDGNEIEIDSIPLHAKTFQAIAMDIVGDVYALDAKTIVVAFTRPIDISKTEIEITNTETKKPRTLAELTTDPDDLRKIYIKLKGSMANNVSHQIVLKQVISTGGIELTADKRLPLTVAWSDVGVLPETPPVSSPDVFTEVAPTLPDPIVSDVPMTGLDIPGGIVSDMSPSPSTTDIPDAHISIDAPDRSEPVPIDRLPQTGAMAWILFLAATLTGILTYIYKKSSR